MFVYNWFLIIVILNTEALQTLTDESRYGRISNGTYSNIIQILRYVPEGFGNKADETKKSKTKYNIFIDIGTLTPYTHRRMGITKESLHNTQSSTTQVISKNKLNFRRQPMIFAKILTTSAPPGIVQVDYRKQYVSNGSKINKTRDSHDIKKKVLTQIQKLENDIKVVKAQIENDAQTIRDLQNEIRKKEKQRAEFENNTYAKVRRHHYTTAIKNEDIKYNFDENSQNLQQQTKTNKNPLTKEIKDIQHDNSVPHKLNRYTEHSNATSNDNVVVKTDGKINIESISFKNIETNKINEDGEIKDFDVKKIKNYENTNLSTRGKHDTKYQYLKNISNEESVENPTISTPSIFDLHPDFETFERFDGEFDWEKFVTSDMYIQLLKNSTSANYRRILPDDENRGALTTPIFNPDMDEPVTSIADKILIDYYLEPHVTDPREEIIFESVDPNSTITRLVPLPGDKKVVPKSLEITLPEIKEPSNLDINIRKSELKYYNDNNVKLNYLKNRRMFLDDQYPAIDGGRNMPTITTIEATVDPLAYDSIMRDMDEDIEIQ